MVTGSDKRFMTRAQAEAAQIDVGLRDYMLRIYNYMASGLALTGLVAAFSANTPAVMNLLYQVNAQGAVAPTGLAFVVMFLPLVFVLAMSFGVERFSYATLQGLFWGFSAAMGLSLTHIFLTYTGESIVRVFFITAATFGAMSLYGYTTKRDLSAWGSFLMMGLIGIVVAMVVNMFLASSALQFAISVIGVLVFTGLTAYDTQRMKAIYYEGDSGEVAGKKTIMGALSLYLNFINLFIMLLHLFGDRR
jgi:FtsH-binding integral membrane protein